MCNIFFIASLDFVVAWQAQGADDEDNYEEDGSWINWVARYNRIIVDCSSVNDAASYKQRAPWNFREVPQRMVKNVSHYNPIEDKWRNESRSAG